MANDRSKAFDVSGNGMLIDGGVWISSGIGAPVHSANNGDVYYQVDNSIEATWKREEGVWIPENPSVQVHNNFSPWFTKNGLSDFIPWGVKKFESIPGMHTATISDAGTATSATSNTLTDTAKSWTVNQFQNHTVYLASGTGAGQWRRVISNTADTLTVVPWGVQPDATTAYVMSNDSSKLVAPVSGKWHVSFHFSVAYQAEFVGLLIWVNGALKSLHFDHQSKNIEFNAQNAKTLELNKDDIVQFSVYIGGTEQRQVFGGEFRFWAEMFRVGKL